MGAVLYLTWRRAASRWLWLAAAGVAVGLLFGVSLACLSTARRTASAYDRILVAADAEDATASHELTPADAAVALDRIAGVAAHHYQAGYVGFIEGIDPALVGVMLASADDGFVVESPILSEGRLPDPDRADEVWINEYLAVNAGLAVDQELAIDILRVDGASTERVEATVVGIGLLPREALADETVLTGVLAFTRAFQAAHEGLQTYQSSRVVVAPGVDLQRDLAPRLSAAGFEVSETRDGERQGVYDALRPSVSILSVAGLVTMVAALVAAGQVVQREVERWRPDRAPLVALGVLRGEQALLRVALVVPIVIVALATASAIVVAVSPLAPVGPLHDLDPAQGVVVDGTVVAVGCTFFFVAVIAFALALSPRRENVNRTSAKAASLHGIARTTTTIAGLSMALRSSHGRRGTWRMAGFATSSVVLMAALTTLVFSTLALTAAPARYGVNWDLTALNAYGDQVPDSVESIFGGNDVEAATSYSSISMLVNGRTVPGLAATVVKDEVGPTALVGTSLPRDGEVVLGIRTADDLDVGLGDIVAVQTALRFDGSRSTGQADLEVVGLVTFAPISLQGTDDARLGSGVLVSRATLDALFGDPSALPEWTSARLAAGVSPSDVIDLHPDGVADATGTPTRWLTSAEPAELRQVGVVGPLMLGAVVVSALLALSVVGHATWTGARRSRRDLTVLRALGFTRRQTGLAAAWHAAPIAVVAATCGIPVGVAVGRWGFGLFARDLSVVDTPSSLLPTMGGLVLVVSLIAALAALAARSVGRRSITGRTLHEGAQGW